MVVINITLVGVAVRDRNLVRNYDQIPEAQLKDFCDLDEVALERFERARK